MCRENRAAPFGYGQVLSIGKIMTQLGHLIAGLAIRATRKWAVRVRGIV